MLRAHRTQRGLSRADIVSIAGLIACLIFAVIYQNRRFENTEFKAELFRQKIKLPDSQVLKIITLGYDNIYADWLWLQSIQAFGSGWITEDRTAVPIYQYFDTLTDIDPKFISAYRFGNLIVGDNRKDHEHGQLILKKGVFKNPNNYDIPYLGTYNAIWTMGDMDQARWFARYLARNEDAPAFMRRLEEYIERETGRYDVALEFNIRYYLEYMVSNNTVELEIAQRRMLNLINDQNHTIFKEAVTKYLEDHGEHPEQIEDLLRPEYLPARETFFVQLFNQSLENRADDIDRVNPKQIPDELVTAIKQDSTRTMAGIPPDPFGTWYYIWGHARQYLTNRDSYDLETRDDVGYLDSARSWIQNSNAHMMQAQSFIMDFIRENDRKPTKQDLEKYLVRDPFGGHYVYDPDAEESEYGVFYSTGARRIENGEDPRLGIYGPGPFPIQLEPMLKDNPSEYEWGLANNYINPQTGEEYYDLIDPDQIHGPTISELEGEV